MILVLMAVALASILSFALLSGAMLQTRTRANACRAGNADYLAESGINLAMYYLQHPELAPALNASGYWAGASGIAIGAGTVSVTVTRDATDKWTYEVSSTGTVGQSGDTQMSRTTSARLYARNEYKVKYAAAFNTSSTIYGLTAVSGDVICPGTLTISGVGGASVSGVAYCAALGGGSATPAGGVRTIASTVVGAPTNSDVNQYQTYVSGTTTYNAATLSTGSLNGTSGTTPLTSSSSNPAGIWFNSGNLTLGDYVTINGTLVVTGNLVVNGKGIVITPSSGYPALVVLGNLQVNQPRKNMTLNGICYVGGQLKSSGDPIC